MTVRQLAKITGRPETTIRAVALRLQIPRRQSPRGPYYDFSRGDVRRILREIHDRPGRPTSRPEPR